MLQVWGWRFTVLIRQSKLSDFFPTWLYGWRIFHSLIFNRDSWSLWSSFIKKQTNPALKRYASFLLPNFYVLDTFSRTVVNSVKGTLCFMFHYLPVWLRPAWCRRECLGFEYVTPSKVWVLTLQAHPLPICGRCCWRRGLVQLGGMMKIDLGLGSIRRKLIWHISGILIW